MTPSETNINRRVAEACGIKFSTDSFGSAVLIENNCNRIFSPMSVDADAVLAAEKFGLFMNRRNCHMTGLLLPGGRVGWAVWEGGEMISSGTFREAICKAILKLSDESTSR